MNEFGRTAMRYWRDHRPTAFAQIPHPEEFFADLGEQIATQVQTMTQAMSPETTSTEAGSTEPDQGNYLTRVGELNAIRGQAIEAAMHELVYGPFPPESSSEGDEETAEGLLWEPFPLRLPPTNPEDEPEYLDYLDRSEREARN